MPTGNNILLSFCLAAVLPSLATAGEISTQTLTPSDDLRAPIQKTDNLFAVVPGRDPNDWSFTLEPYLWTMGASGEVGVKGLPATQIDYSAKTVLQHLDWGIMGKAELRKGRWGLLGDGLFAQLSASADPPNSLYSSSTAKLQQGMASLALAYRLIDDRRGFLDVYAGARYNYMGFNINASTDSAGIADFSDTAAQRIAQSLGEQAQAFVAQNANAIASQVANAVQNNVSSRDLEKTAGFSGGIDRSDLNRIVSQLGQNSGAYREMVAAVAQQQIAAAKNQLTAAIQNRVAQAQKNLASALAHSIESNLPTSAEGSQWWVDPIIGFRGQVNLTRWLFLAAQSDVGGFGAGSFIAWNVQASVGVNFTRHISGELGYRYFYMDYDRGGAIYDAGEFGAFCGIGLRF